MADLETKVTPTSLEAFLHGLDDEQRQDCEKLVRLMKKVTGEEPRMYGPNIVGFGKYHFRYDNGHQGDMFLVGFAPREKRLGLYLPGRIQYNPLLDKLGKHLATKSWLYIKGLDDVDATVLEELIVASVAHTRKRWG